MKCWQIMENVETALAIEMFCAAQALDFRLPTKPGKGPRVALETLRKTIRHADQDRLFGEDIQAALGILRNQDVLEAVEADVGELK